MAKNYGYARYSKTRDEKASLNYELIKGVLSTIFKIPHDEFIKPSSIGEDAAGIDLVINNKTIQIKNIEYLGFDTVTIPCENLQKYINNKIDWIFHSYYPKENPNELQQYVFIKLNKLNKLNKKGPRTNRETGTDFWFWDYKDIIDAKAYRAIDPNTYRKFRP